MSDMTNEKEIDFGAIAVSIAEKVNPKLSAQEVSFFIAGFIECAKYFKIAALAAENEALKNQIKHIKHIEHSDMYWISQFQKVTEYWYKKETPNMDKSEFLSTKIRNAPKSDQPLPPPPITSPNDEQKI